LRAIDQLRQSPLAQLVQLGNTLHAGSQEIAAMWRFTRNNRRFPHQNGGLTTSGLRLSQLPKLQTQSEGVMFLEVSLGSGFAPVVGVEPGVMFLEVSLGSGFAPVVGVEPPPLLA